MLLWQICTLEMNNILHKMGKNTYNLKCMSQWKLKDIAFSVANGPLCSHYSSGTKHALLCWLRVLHTSYIHGIWPDHKCKVLFLIRKKSRGPE